MVPNYDKFQQQFLKYVCCMMAFLFCISLPMSKYNRGWFYRPIPFVTLESTLKRWRVSEQDVTYHEMTTWHLMCKDKHSSLALCDGHVIKAITQFQQVDHAFVLRGVATDPGEFETIHTILELAKNNNIYIDWESLQYNERCYLEMIYCLL